MKAAAIICEYNPFHSGHLRLINSLRENQPDRAIIGIMSGCFVQRGDVAIAPPQVRAQAAVECGVNLVLEMPYPYSMSCAEVFARAGVLAAERLGVVDTLAFGSECGDADALAIAAGRMLSKEFADMFGLQKKNMPAEGHAALCERAYNRLYGKPDFSLSEPNNILALEYMKALIKTGSETKAYTIKRTSGDGLMSAHGIRALFFESGIDAAAPYLPRAAFEIYKKAYESGEFGARLENISSAVLYNFKTHDGRELEDIADLGGGLAGRLCTAARQSFCLEDFFDKCKTKKYTDARIRRAALFALMNTKKAEICDAPPYLRLLAADAVGKKLLTMTEKCGKIKIITKYAEYKKFDGAALAAAKAAIVADDIFYLSLPQTKKGSVARSPYLK